jgi:peptidoglycan/LPS O-acetylase OafA/YrhL
VLAAERLRAFGHGAEEPAVIAFLLALSVLAGWLLYRLVETPFMALRERYFPSNSPRPTVAAVSVSPESAPTG